MKGEGRRKGEVRRMKDDGRRTRDEGRRMKGEGRVPNLRRPAIESAADTWRGRETGHSEGRPARARGDSV